MTGIQVKVAILMIVEIIKLSSAFVGVPFFTQPIRLLPHANRKISFLLFSRFQSTPTTSSYRNLASTKISHSSSSLKFRVYLAVGSNLGDRYQNIYRALQLLSIEHDVRLFQTSFLYETEPMYITNQTSFLNGVVEIETNLEPLQLLQSIKLVEAKMGRDFSTERNGPRPVDLDILSCTKIASDGQPDEQITMESATLTIPHPRISERPFVLVPFIDIAGPNLRLCGMKGTLAEALCQLKLSEPNGTKRSAVRVIPLPRGRFIYFNETLVMGILNVTPDSFSDGGLWTSSVDDAVNRALAMEREGAAIIDVGGESTRPGSLGTSIGEQIERTIPVIEGIRKASDVAISIDTRHAAVALAAVEVGADIVNDVSGGTFDSAMLSSVGRLGVPIILMHMRGTPETMQSLTSYNDIVEEVGTALKRRSDIAAKQHSLHKWLQILDPGIGFAKDLRGNLLLLKNIAKIRQTVEEVPILLGTSRKGFIGAITSEQKAEDRDPGSVASCITALSMENSSHSNQSPCSILRVHNVSQCRQATLVMDAIRNVR